MKDARSENAALELLALLEHRRRELDGCGPAAVLRLRPQPGQRLPRQVERVCEQPQRVLALGGVLDLREHLARPHERLLAIRRPLELEPHAMDDVARSSAQPLLEARRRVGRILALRQRHDAHVEAQRGRELHPTQRRVLPCRVGVEAEVEAARQPLQLLQLALRQRGSHRSHDRLEPGLAQGDHVGVALDHDRALLLRDRRAGEIEAVEDRRLVEELTLRRVDVLAPQRIVVVQLARLEADDPSPGVGKREHQALREVVVPARVREPGAAQLLGA